MLAGTLDTLLRKLDEEHAAASHYLAQGNMRMHEYWARHYHGTAELLLVCTGIDHRNRYAS